MEESKNRLIQITQNMDDYGLKYTRFNAVNGKKLPQDFIEDRVSTICQKLVCSKGFIGASFSHIFIWNHIAQSIDQNKWYMILEDDVNFIDESFHDLQKVQNFIGKLQNKPCIINISPYNILEPRDVHIVPVDYLSGLSAYLINVEAAKLLTQYYSMNKLRYIIDTDASLVPGLNKFSTSKQVVKTSFDIRDAVNKSPSFSVPLLQSFIELLFPKDTGDKINFIINSSTVHLNMKYTISNGHILLFILFFIALIIRNEIIFTYVLLETLLIFFQKYLF